MICTPRSILGAILTGGLMLWGAAAADQAPLLESSAIQRAGLTLRLDASARNAILEGLAAGIGHWAREDKAQLKKLQADYQNAILYAADPGIYETLPSEAIAAVDDALEHVFDFEEINRGNDWEPLIYAYGYFNRDVTAAEIAAVARRWHGLSEAERGPVYPTYVHVIDAVCKPLSMGPLSGGDTVAALEAAVPLLNEMLAQEAKPGRAFHPPSHAALVLGPLYERWPEDTPEGAVVRKYLGTRDEFIALMTRQLIGAQDRASLPNFAYGYYAYSGRYIANTLARMDARAAADTLRRSLDIYVETNAPAATIAYTRRALAALGDEAERAALLAGNSTAKELVWLCRNARGEGRQWAETHLGGALGRPASVALDTYLRGELDALGGPLAHAGLNADIPFAKAGGETLTLDAFVPEGAGPFPTCILVHGGGFTKGDKQSYIKPLFEPLSAAGFTWFTINYRLAPGHRFPACADDVNTAIRWVKGHAAEYKADPARIALIGESAGGHLVSYTGVLGAGDTSVAAVVPFYAPHDLEFQVDGRNALGEGLEGLFGVTELNEATRRILRDASANTYIRRGLPPFLLVHGTNDDKVPYEQSPRFQAQMHAAGNHCGLITIEAGGHGMGGWARIEPSYADQVIRWLKDVLND